MTVNTSADAYQSILNTTDLPGVEEHISSSILSAIWGTMATVGNVIAVVVIFLQRHSLTRANQLIGNLALSDLVTGCYTLAISGIVSHKAAVQDDLPCVLVYSFMLFGTFASVNALLLVTIDRYLIIVFPLKYKMMTSRPRGEAAIAIGWLVAFVIAFLPTFNIFGRKPLTEICQLFSIVTKEYIICIFVIAYLIPLLVMIMLYVKIAIVAQKHRRQIHSLQVGFSHTESNHQETGKSTISNVREEGQSSQGGIRADNSEIIQRKARSREQWKATKTIFIVLGFFVISWVPFYICMILMTMVPDPEA